ncbi:hypothetical protein BST43_19450 [Mycobacteroides saopaulense]|uniref:DUF3558 domain-containing protein n=1 Tax=Mycobacteroides saopaulense TaxID=1578165 RepID=A0A1X0ITG5_9MYCO|nr:DUF3558 family protein [Mycobacteroides saopaulense]ORB52132.1 hypothetical protein BST43_19450 [Mycobacteroides saopaulense]
MTRTHRLALLTAVALTIAGCGGPVAGDAVTAASSTSSRGATPTSPTVTNTLPGPHPPPNQNNDGTTFDPCLAYTASELSGWGIDPATVNDVAIDDTLQRGCTWKGDGWVLQQLITNRSISEYLDPANYPDAKPLTIAGLQASQHRLGQAGTTFCSVQIPSQKAVIATLVSVRDSKAENQIPDACTKAIQIATDTAGKLPK